MAAFSVVHSSGGKRWLSGALAERDTKEMVVRRFSTQSRRSCGGASSSAATGNGDDHGEGRREQGSCWGGGVPAGISPSLLQFGTRWWWPIMAAAVS